MSVRATESHAQTYLMPFSGIMDRARATEKWDKTNNEKNSTEILDESSWTDNGICLVSTIPSYR